jgi:hypothetical chaperone protein
VTCAADDKPASSEKPSIYAIDFGTSNSLLAAANTSRVFEPAPIDTAAPDPTILRSILYFPNKGPSFVGQQALSEYVERGMEGRFLRSLKRHLPARGFRGTIINERKVSLEDLVSVPLRIMRERANTHFGVDVRDVVLGRPARFSLDDADDDFAEDRLREAAKRAGFETIHCLPEPVAAAYEFRHSDSDGEAALTVVCDFGGGTSDFTVMRLSDKPFHRDDVLAIGGIPMAGDALDASIMRASIAKHFGAAVSYQVPFGSNVLTMPTSVIEQLCSPAHLSMLRRPDVAEFLRNVASWSLGPDDRHCLDQLATLVDDALGFQLFEQIELTKRTLSGANEAVCSFHYPSIEVTEPVSRIGFESAAERAVRSILDTLDDTIARSGLDPAEVALVCCTGGTAKVPRIAQEIRTLFPNARLSEFQNFHSVVNGLARHAQTLLS